MKAAAILLVLSITLASGAITAKEVDYNRRIDRLEHAIAVARTPARRAQLRQRLVDLRADRQEYLDSLKPAATPVPTPTPVPNPLVAPWYVPPGWQWPAAVTPEISDPLVLVCSGQSNMVGAEQSAATVPPGLREPLARIYIWQPNGWAAYRPGINFQTWGPEAEFARRFREANPNRTLLIMKYAVGGRQLAAHATREDWSPNSVGELFDFMVKVRSESSAAGASGETALLWLQGESDGFVLTAAQRYEANLRDFIAAARDRWALGSAKIIIAKIHTGVAYPIPYAATIRAAQSKVAAELGLPVIDTAGYPLMSDRMHYTSDGQVMVGAAFFEAWRQ